jgi:hypothetical protein
MENPSLSETYSNKKMLVTAIYLNLFEFVSITHREQTIKPQYTQSLERTHGFKGKNLYFAVSSYIIEPQSYVIQQNQFIQRLDEKLTQRISENTGKSEPYSVKLSFPVKVCNVGT